MRRGVSPIVTVLLLTALFLGMASTTFYFLSDQQRDITGTAERPVLSTINISCDVNQVTWWIRNDAPYGTGSTVDILIRRDGVLDTSLSREDVSAPAAIQNGASESEFPFTVSSLIVGERYEIEAVFREADVETTCVVGDPWWNSNWDYRRAINYPPSNPATARFSLDTAQLIADQKMQPDCDDIRVIQSGSHAPYDIDDSDCGAAVTTIRFDSIGLGTPYVYYGNFNAESNQSTVSGSPPTATLQEEERINLPG